MRFLLLRKRHLKICLFTNLFYHMGLVSQVVAAAFVVVVFLLLLLSLLLGVLWWLANNKLINYCHQLEGSVDQESD